MAATTRTTATAADSASWVVAEVLRAHVLIKEHVLRTPVLHSKPFSDEHFDVHFKLESEQHTGSFKARGALSKMLQLSEAEAAKGLVTASTGNHALATGFACERTGRSGTIFVPTTIAPAKAQLLAHYPQIKLEHVGEDCVETELAALRAARERGATWFSPYNDRQVIGGQGTVGLELVEQLASVDVVFVPVGGGGLISGIAGYLKVVQPTVHVVGCQPAQSAVMMESIKAGAILDMPSGETLSDGTAGGVEPGAVTFDVCRACVDEWVTVDEREIGDALFALLDYHHKIVEGSAAMAFACCRKWMAANVASDSGAPRGGPGENGTKRRSLAVVLCGSNIATAKVQAVVNSRMPANSS